MQHNKLNSGSLQDAVANCPARLLLISTAALGVPSPDRN